MCNIKLFAILNMISKNRLKDILSLKHKKFRDQTKQFLVEGIRLCEEALRSDFKMKTLLISSDSLLSQQIESIVQLARQKRVEIVEIREADVTKLADTVHSQGIFAVIRQNGFYLDSILTNKNKLIILIDGAQDPGNVGTIIRTSDWFGVDAILLGAGSVELFNPKVVRSTMGSIFHLPILEEVAIELVLPRLKELGYQILAADVRGEFLYHRMHYRFPAALIIGNENTGISKTLIPYLDYAISIPGRGKAESLNMALAAAIIISRISIESEPE